MADTVSDAQEWFREAQDALSDQRRQIEEDLKFSDPSDPQQWDEQEKRQRETDPGGSRPCLVMDQTSQYTATVVGQIQQSPPSLHTLPATGGADKTVAEQLDGWFRQIEYSSRAEQHYMRALTSAARAGVGYLIVRPEYTDRALNHQEPRISSEGDPLRVVFDPWSVELDGSDADRGIILTPMSFAAFEREFGKKADKCSFGDPDGTKRDSRESVMVGEEWRKESTTKMMVVALDPKTQDEFSLSADEFEEARAKGNAPKFVRDYKDKTTTVRWVRMSGSEILTPETEYPAQGIGIVPVYGYVGWSEGRMRYCGIPRRARDPQRAYNYHVSEIRAFMSQAPKAPWLASLRAIRGLEPLWDRATVDSRAVLPYHDIDEQANPIPAPQRMQIAANLANYVSGAQQALHDIEAALGMYQATLGAPSNETSGVAIDARKQQGEAATSFFPTNLSAGVAQVGKLCMQMVPRLVDTKRQLRILGVDQSPGVITVDPAQEEASKETEEGMSINPNVGAYDVRVVVGSPFSTQRQQAQSAFTEIMRANPELTPAIAPLWAGTLDIPNADKLAQVLTAMAPDPVKAILQPQQGKEGPTAAQLQAQVHDLTQKLQQAVQIAHEAQAEANQAHSELASKQQEAQNSGTKLAIDAYNAETNRLKVVGPAMDPNQVQALIQQQLQEMLADPNPWPGEPAGAQVPMPAQPQQPMPMQQPPQQPAPPDPAPPDPSAMPPAASPMPLGAPQ